MCVCARTCAFKMHPVLCVCNFLFVHIPNIFGNCRAEERYLVRQRGETRQKKIERKGRMGER